MTSKDPEEGAYRPPPHQLGTWMVIGTAFVVVVALLSIRTSHTPDSSRPYPARPQPPDQAAELMDWEPPDDEYYPCSDCHEDEPTDRERRELEDEHDDLEIAHGDLWCFSCHDADNRDRLHLANDAVVGFDDSWQLCTQCHGKKLADWRAGVHGKRTGHWRGPKEYRTCVSCHSPHAPPFKPLEPEPAPRRPEHITMSASTAVPEEPSHGEH